MNANLTEIKQKIYDQYSYDFSNYKEEEESKEYDACTFILNHKLVISRTAKITPKKIGQFVTFWKRNLAGVTLPFCTKDNFDYYVVNTRKDNKLGQFVFPKSVLAAKGIVTTENKEGKRGFRVYPSWDIPNNKQAQRTQKWQLDFFYALNEPNTQEKVKKLYR
ncbi:MAG: MepB family protein [Mesonia hippocampi]|uniref:MepB family protein n=1 Tax=Mesonia hippocampi TaxID=1628250 RepID=UPI003F9520FF